VTVEVINPFNISTYSIEKESILDIKAIDDRGEQYDIEAQSATQPFYIRRSVYYIAKVHGTQLLSGEDYNLLNASIGINLVNFKIFKNHERIHSKYLLQEADAPNDILTDDIVIHFLELPKLQPPFTTGGIRENSLKNWLLFFKYEGKKGEMEERIMKKLIQEDQNIANAHEAYLEFTSDAEMRDIYESRLKWQRDYNTKIVVAHQEGRVEGLKEGRVEEKKATARNMLAKGLSIELIEEVTGLSREEISKLMKATK
jgi:predicted transposase/invertase (TIGR01784 family)